MSAYIKRLLRDKFTEALPGVAVSYGEPARDLRVEHVWFGKIAGPMELLTFQRSGQQIPRKHTLSAQVHIRVLLKGQDQERAEERAEEIGDAIIAYLALQPKLGGADGILLAQVTATDLDSGIDETGAIAVNTLTVSVITHLS